MLLTMLILYCSMLVVCYATDSALYYSMPVICYATDSVLWLFYAGSVLRY